MGGDLDWIYEEMPVPETLTQEVMDGILKAEKMTLPEPIKSRLGYHVILVCETRVSTRVQETTPEMDPRLTSMLERDRSEVQAPGQDMQIPN